MKFFTLDPKRICLGAPGSHFDFGAVQGLLSTMRSHHNVSIINYGRGWTDFDETWAHALNLAESGEATHFAMLHSDVNPCPGWLDMLAWQLDKLDADLISVPSPLKDERGLTSCGIGDVETPYFAYRRFTVRDVLSFPETFDAATVGYPGKVLLHNTACWLCDLRKPVFFKTDEAGELLAHFAFPKSVIRGCDGKWMARWESEDWFFSRQLHLLGAKTYITRAVRLTHRGPNDFPNYRPWGTFENGDEDTAVRWRNNGETCKAQMT